jgi:hypothetical protein
MGSIFTDTESIHRSFISAGVLSILLGGLVSIGQWIPALVVLGCLLLGTLLVHLHVQKGVSQIMAIEVPVALLFLSVVQWRTRSLSAATEAPVDAAALVHVVLIGAAVLLSVVALADPAMMRRQARHPTFMLLALYAAVGTLSAVLAVDPGLAAFQAVQVGACVLVIYAAVQVDHNAPFRVARVALSLTLILVLATWAEALVAPGRGFAQLDAFSGASASPIDVRLQGIFPATNWDTVGTYGAVFVTIGRDWPSIRS